MVPGREGGHMHPVSGSSGDTACLPACLRACPRFAWVGAGTYIQRGAACAYCAMAACMYVYTCVPRRRAGPAWKLVAGPGRASATACLQRPLGPQLRPQLQTRWHRGGGERVTNSTCQQHLARGPRPSGLALWPAGNGDTRHTTHHHRRERSCWDLRRLCMLCACAVIVCACGPRVRVRPKGSVCVCARAGRQQSSKERAMHSCTRAPACGHD